MNVFYHIMLCRIIQTAGPLTQVLWDQLFTVVHDEDSPDVQLDVILLLFVLKEVKRSAAGDEEEGAELKLTLH